MRQNNRPRDLTLRLRMKHYNVEREDCRDGVMGGREQAIVLSAYSVPTRFQVGPMQADHPSCRVDMLGLGILDHVYGKLLVGHLMIHLCQAQASRRKMVSQLLILYESTR